MRIGQKYVGKMVEVQWMDPMFQRIEVRDSPVGRASLATWRERGIVIDVSDGVVKIEHSSACHAAGSIDSPEEHAFTPIPEVLIERIKVFEPVSDEKEPPGVTKTNGPLPIG